MRASTCTYIHKGGKASDSLKDSHGRYCTTTWTLRTLFGAILGPFNSFYVVFMVYLDEEPRENSLLCVYVTAGNRLVGELLMQLTQCCPLVNILNVRYCR